MKIAAAMDDRLWDQGDRFYYDRLRTFDGRERPLRVRSIAGLIALCAVTYLNPRTLAVMPRFQRRFDDYPHRHPALCARVSHIHEPGQRGRRLLSVVSGERLSSVLKEVRRDHAPDLLFPQMTLSDANAANWSPSFVDYLYVSFTNSTAFSPTDAMPLSGRAKLAMLTEALLSLVTVGLVVARAVNILT